MTTTDHLLKQGLLLLAHGARDPAWALPFQDVAGRIRAAHPTWEVSVAFLEFMAPSIVVGGEALARSGCTRIDLLPLFLGAGGHVRKDIPVFVRELQAAHPGVTWVLHPAVGEAGSVIQAMADAAASLVGGASPSDPSDCSPSDAVRP